MESKSKKKMRLRAVVVIFAVLLLIGGFAASAAYINLNMVKRVVSTQGFGGTPFSSNYLLLVPKDTTTYSVKNIYCPEGADTAEFEINVCNYVQNDPSKLNENDISYAFILTLQNSEGTINTGTFSGLSVTDNNGVSYSFTNGICRISDRLLTGNRKSVDTYSIIIPKQMVSSVELRAEAEPTDSSSYSAVNGNKLGRIFTFSEYNASSTTWTGSFSETTADGYDAFNYIIKGQGKGTVTLTWDHSQLEINRVFLENNGLAVTSEGSISKLTIEVDSTAGQNRYDIQFYKTENGIYTDMGTINGYVTVNFAEDAS